jgi:hypothetical protein
MNVLKPPITSLWVELIEPDLSTMRTISQSVGVCSTQSLQATNVGKRNNVTPPGEPVS